ncbi:MAG: Ig-like domain-containing protein [Clostridiales bacterium]|nr:Ig-like domain-containing protein [Candidatus Crickella caballi]
MKRRTLIAVFAAIMVMASTAMCWAASGLELVSSYPEDGQTNTSMENAGVKLQFNNAVNSDAAKKANAKAIKIVDPDGKTVPTQILFSDEEKGLVLAVVDVDNGYVVLNNSEYKCIIDADFVDNDGNTLGEETVISFKTYNQKLNNMVNMLMMVVMFGGIFFFSIKQKDKENEEEEASAKQAVNPYKEARRTGKSVETVKAEIAKQEEKEAKKRARKHKEEKQVLGFDYCADLLNNVYHVHAPAPISKEDRSISALKKMRKAEKDAAKAKDTKKKAKKK